MTEPKYEFNEASAKMMRRIRIQLLARPPLRRLLPFPPPEMIRDPLVIPRSALTFKTTKRLKLLSRPKEWQISKKYTPPMPVEHYVSPAALKCEASPRIIRLATPRVHKFEIEEKSRTTMRLERESRANREEWLLLRAAPKKLPPPRTFIFKRRRKFKVTYAMMKAHLNQLAKPRRQRKKRRVRKILSKAKIKVKKPKYKASKRTCELAQPKTIAESRVKPEPLQMPTTSASYQASDRTIELAAPLVRASRASEAREDAFTVSKQALKAKCSERLAELARPIIRRKSKYDPRENAFTVSRSALNAKCTPRLIELSKPIVRQ